MSRGRARPSALTAFVNIVLAGRCPSDAASVFFGGRLYYPWIRRPEKFSGFTMRRLASKYASSSGASRLKSYFYFHQLAVWDAWWVWGGDLFGPYVSRGAASGSQLVEIDFTNGFNSFHKREMLLTVFNRIPEHLCIPVSIQSVILPVIGRTLFCLRKVPNVSSCLSLVAELLTSQGKLGGAENDGHEIAGHEIDGPSCRAWKCRTWNCKTLRALYVVSPLKIHKL